MQGFILLAITAAEKCTLFLLDINFLECKFFTKLMEIEI